MTRMDWRKARKFSGSELKYQPGKILANGVRVPRSKLEAKADKLLEAVPLVLEAAPKPKRKRRCPRKYWRHQKLPAPMPTNNSDPNFEANMAACRAQTGTPPWED